MFQQPGTEYVKPEGVWAEQHSTHALLLVLPLAVVCLSMSLFIDFPSVDCELLEERDHLFSITLSVPSTVRVFGMYTG